MVKKISYNQGVTLVEMIVVVGIFALVSSVLLFNYSDFRTGVSVRNLANEIALSIRKAQSFATSVRGVTVNTNTRDYPGYGMVFSTGSYNPDLNPDQKEFLMFVDIPPNQSTPPDYYYSQSNGNCAALEYGNECFEKFTITGTDIISKIEVLVAGGATVPVEVDNVSITFKRPNPDAYVCVMSPYWSCNFTWAKITINNGAPGTSLSRTVTVWNTGQISVQ